jgi:NitT/TauT family transport system permease protein
MAVVDDDRLDRELSGLDELELFLPKQPSRLRRFWSATWPKLAGIAIGIALWQIVVWTGWKPTYLFPGPFTVFHHIWEDRHDVLSGTGTTLRQAIEFFAISVVVGTLVAIVISRFRFLHKSVSPLVMALQAMPSVAWVPIAILLFGIKTEAVLFVTLAGSIPAVIMGTRAAIQTVPPVLLQAGQVLGARGINRYRYIVLPAALPGYMAGVRQAWAFAWRSLMAGELIVPAHGSTSLGALLSAYQDQSLAADVLGVMVAILAVGLLIDAVVFQQIERVVLERRGLLPASDTIVTGAGQGFLRTFLAKG